MNQYLLVAAVGCSVWTISVAAVADANSRWGNYRGVERPSRPAPLQHRPPAYPGPQWGNPHRPAYPVYPRPQSVRPNVELHYHAPAQTEYQYQQQIFLNGQPASVQYTPLYSSRSPSGQELPEAPRGYHWVLSSGYYRLVPNEGH